MALDIIGVESPVFQEIVERSKHITLMAEQLLNETKKLKEKKYYTAEEAAEYLRIGLSTLEKYEDEIGYSKKGIKRFTKSDLDAWVELHYYKKKQRNFNRI